MATRFYIPASAPVAGLTPSFDAGWNFTSEATRHELARAKTNSALTVGTRVGPWTATAGQKALDRQLISPPLDAQTISGTFSAMMSSREYATTDNVDRPMVAVKVINSSGTVVATLLALTTPTGANTTEMSATAQTSCTFASGASLSSYSCSAGDRILVEIGFSNVTAGTTPEASNTYGDPTSGTDATLGNNAATSVTPWIEFSANLTFAAPTVTSASPNNGPETGGGTVTLAGTGIVAGATVTFGGSSATSVSVTSSSALTCSPPAGTGVVNIVVTNPDTQTGTLTSGFTYNPPPPTAAVFTAAGGAQLTCHETYDSSGNYPDSMGLSPTFTQATAGNRPTVDTTSSPAGKTLIDCDGTNDFVATAAGIPTGSYPTTAGRIFVEHVIDVPVALTESRIVDYDGWDYWTIGTFGSGIYYRSGANADASATLNIPHFLWIEHDFNTGISTMYVDGVAQTDTGTNSAQTRTELIAIKSIGGRTNAGEPHNGSIGYYGVGWATTWGSTERAALYAAMQSWYNDVPGGGGDDISGSVPIGVSFAGTLTGAGALAGSVPIAVTPAGAIAAVGSLAGSVPVAITFAGTLGSASSLAGAVPVALTFAGTLTAVGSLSGSVPIALSPAGSLTGIGALAGAIPIAIAPAATLRGIGSLVGSVPIALAFGGTVAGRGDLVGSVPVALTFAGVLGNPGSGTLVGSVPLGIAFSGTLTARGELSGSTTLSLTPVGALSGRGALSGSIPISVTPAATLIGAAPLVGSIPISIATQGTLTGRGELVGVVPLSLSPAGIVTALGSLVGSLPIAIALGGQLTGIGQLTGSVPIAFAFAYLDPDDEPGVPGGFVTVVPVVLTASARTFPTSTTANVVLVSTSAKLGVLP